MSRSPAPRLLWPVLLAVILTGPASTATAQRVIHRVRFGESLAAISNQYYGSTAFAEILARANGLSVASHKLSPGAHIRVPTAWYHVPPKATSLPAVAKEFLGDSRRWPALGMLNSLRGRRRRIPAGSQLLIPFTLPFTVSEGQSFADISQRAYGTKKYGGLISSFNFISDTSPSPGTQLAVPHGTPRILPQVLHSLTNERVLGLSEAVSAEARRGLQEANALVRRGEYWAVPLRLLKLLSSAQASDNHVAEAFKLMAVAYVALDRQEFAVDAFREALLRHPDLTMDVVTTSPKVMRAFVDAKAGGKDASGAR